MRNERNTVRETPLGKIIVNRNDLHIGASILRGGYYELDQVRELVELIERSRKFERPQILDVGANIGTHTLMYSEISGAEVHSFEAQRAVFYMLAGTLALNGIDNVWAYHRAVSDESDTVIEFDRPNYESQINVGGFELLPPHWSDGGTLSPIHEKERVTTLRIDELKLDRVDYIKMDIEGMEARALRGARETILECRPVLVIETLKSNFVEIVEILRDLNYGWQTRGVDLWCFPAERDF